MGDMERFTVKVALHQGSALSPCLFDLVMDVIAEDVKEAPSSTIMFVDDIVLFRNMREGVAHNEVNERNVTVQDHVQKKVAKFKYLGSTVSEDGVQDEEVERRIQAGWRNWRRMSGVLCDEALSQTKGKIFEIAVRPALTFEAQT